MSVDELEEEEANEEFVGEGVFELEAYRPPMSRNLTFERLYNLGNYSNITFKTSLNEIPEQFALNSDLVNKVYYLQMIEVEKAYRKYIELYSKIKTFSTEQYAEAMSFLEQEKETTMDEIKKLFITQGV